ncbi:MAG: VOC family protein, partial [Cyanobacteria bacterium P01_A01_bin.15]
MKIDHIHFFVEDAARQRNWFIKQLGWTFVKRATLCDRNLEILRYRDTLFALSSPRTATGPVAQYLRTHAPGVANVAIQVENLAAAQHRLGRLSHPRGSDFQNKESQTATAAILSQLVGLDGPAQLPAWANIAGWGGLSHTLIERRPRTVSTAGSMGTASQPQGIDHIVLNVPTGELQAAVEYYGCLFELQKQQRFNIQTEQSGLNSQVLFAPSSQLYFNINEPTSPRSQIQTFLDANRGAGIQHIALHSEPIVPTVTALRQRGVPLLSVPLTYYRQLQQRLRACRVNPVQASEWHQIVEQQILLDWQPKRPESLLLQIFSQPIFSEPTFFLSLLSGAGPFRALVRATFWPFIKPLKRRQRRSANL